MKKSIIFGLAFLVFIITAYWGYTMRKPMPYEFRILALNGDILIVNKTTWNKQDLIVQYKAGNITGETILDGDTNSAVIKNASLDNPFSFKIFRKDIKGRLLYKPYIANNVILKNKSRLVAFVGASIGLAWDLEHFPERTGDDTTAILYWPKYEFDKGNIIEHITKLKIKPDAAIIKECSLYFPRDEKKAIKDVTSWFDLLAKNNIQPIAATTTPVTKENSDKHRGRAQSIQDYNKLLRQKSFKVLDLEKALLDGNEGQYMKNDYAQDDGLHIEKKGYERMDEFLREILK